MLMAIFEREESVYWIYVQAGNWTEQEHRDFQARSKLFEATKNDDLGGLKEAMAHGANVNDYDANDGRRYNYAFPERTALHWAIINDACDKVVEYLLSQGADPYYQVIGGNLLDYTGFECFQLAKFLERDSILRILEEKNQHK